MKKITYILFLMSFMIFASCKETIDLYPQSNLNTGTYYANLAEINTALTGCYSNMQNPMLNEWQMTELRTDNAKQGNPGSTASTNRDLSDLDMFIPSTSHANIYTYWLASYNNIRNLNLVLQKLGTSYDAASGNNVLGPIEIPIPDADRKKAISEALFIRAYHYYNLVRLFGDVFLVTTPITPTGAKAINRSSVTDIYKLIEADLKFASANGISSTFTAMATADRGRASTWAAKGLLAKVYLNLNRKADAIILLQDVITNSGYSLLPAYANVFSITNEMNAEILFTIRYKAGGVGLGSSFANTFAPLGSGAAVINGDGRGLNYPTTDLDAELVTADARKAVTLGTYGTGTAAKLYVKKFLSPVTLANDAENDWPILRYSDVLLMMAEAQGFNATGVGYINQVRARSLTGAVVVPTTVADFEKALSTERRLEFAFENQRFFDLQRFNVTLTTITAEQTMKAHFAKEYDSHYKLYVAPAPTLLELQNAVIPNRLLLPIPQREIDTNTQLKISQNPGY